MATVVHVTHEAVHKVGGIGAVLQGLIAAPAYALWVERTLLVGPLSDFDTPEPLGPDGEVLYDGWNGIRTTPAAPALTRVESQFGVRLVYGRRAFADDVCPEILLVDCRHPSG